MTPYHGNHSTLCTDTYLPEDALQSLLSILFSLGIIALACVQKGDCDDTNINYETIYLKYK